MSAEVKSLLKFFGLTFALSWICFISAVFMVREPHAPAISAFAGVIALLGVFGPAIVALALTAREEQGAGLTALLRRVVYWQVSWRWYAFAILYMAVIKFAAAFVARLITGSWPPFGHVPLILIVLAIVVSTPVQSGEEIGWRGYALPRMTARMGFAGASVLLGVIWALWHLPLFFLRGSDTYGQSFPIWALDVTALSVAIAWLYFRTNGSLLLTMLMHSAINQTSGIVPSAIANAHEVFSIHASLVGYLTLALLWIPAIYFLWRSPDVIYSPPSRAPSATS
jgi:uncharacterized protein